MSKQDLTRQEEFKRATAGTLRAIAHANAEVQVAVQPGPGGVSGKRVRLPLPTRALPATEMAKLRGAADAAALRLRHHSEAVHAARLPVRREAKEVYDALEDVRVEAVGSKHMSGVAANLRARLTDMCETEGYDRMTRKDQLPLPAALALLTRERISGEAAPAAAQRVLELWRDSLAIHLDAPFHLIRLAFPDMMAARHGRIVVVSSTAATIGAPAQAAYSASKAGVLGLVRSVAQDGAPFGITCNAVLPGWVRTAMSEADAVAESARTGIEIDEIWRARAASYAAGRTVDAEEVASVICYLASDEASGVSGEELRVALGGVW